MRLINSFLNANKFNANPLLAIGFITYSSYHLALYLTNFLYKVGAIKMHEATQNNLKEWSVEDLHSKFNKCFIRIDTNYLKSS